MWRWFFRTQLAFNMLRREKARLFVALVGIIFADLLIFMQLGFKGALFLSCGTLHRSFKGDLCLVHPYYQTLIVPQTISRDYLNRCLANDKVAEVHSVRVGMAPWRNPQNGRVRSIQILAFDPGFCILKDPEVERQMPVLNSLGGAIFDRLSRPEFGPIEELYRQSGQPVTTELFRKQVNVGGFFSLGASFASDGNVIVSDTTFKRIFPDSQRQDIDFGFVFLKPNQDLTQVQRELQTTLGDVVSVLTRAEFESREMDYWAAATGIGEIFQTGAVMGFLVGVVIVYQILNSGIQDHLPQYATLKAMGYSNVFLLVTLTQEAVTLAVLGFVPASLLSIVIYDKLSVVTHLPILMPPERLVEVLASTLAMCLTSAVIASRRLITADPAEIF